MNITLNNLLGSGTTLPSLIKDPFLKDKVIRVWINGSISYSGEKWEWYGSIEFKNGKTKGEQRTTNYETFEQVIIELKSILQSLKP